MTPEQRAELERLDAAVEAAPETLAPYRDKARFWSEIEGGETELIAVCEAMMRVRARLPGYYDPRRAARDEWAMSRDTAQTTERRRYLRACAIASCVLALEEVPDTKGWLGDGAKVALMSANQASIRADFARGREEEGESLGATETEALLLDVVAGWQAGAPVFERALQLREAANESKFAKTDETFERLAPYQIIAHLTRSIERAPDDAMPLLSRANYFLNREKQLARLDLERARARFPGVARVYEMQWHIDYDWSATSTIAMASHDYAGFIQGALRSGVVAGTVEDLASYGAATLKYDGHEWPEFEVQRHAYFSLAIERAGADASASLYAGRADAARRWLSGYDDYDECESSVAFEAMIDDYARAYALGDDEASEHLVHWLLNSPFAPASPRPTAHEQLKNLLALRARLLANGLGEEATRAIIAEVEASFSV